MSRLLNLEPNALTPDSTDAAAVVGCAAERFGHGLVMSSSFGAESAALIHLANSIVPQIPIIFVDTGFLFEETYDFLRQLRQRMLLNLRVYRPLVSAEAYLASSGEERTWRRDVNACCAINKNEPFERAMRELKPQAWLRGIRRDQSATRETREVVEWSNRFNCYAISPLLNYSSADVHAYIKLHGLPCHPLFDQGYTSIGCSPRSCTRPIQIGEHARAGRWSGTGKVECGLHLE